MDKKWANLQKERTRPLFGRFSGYFRAEVVETNDPLDWHRIRFRCPELHDTNLPPGKCPWADRAPWLGGRNAGSWTHPVIGDIIWITWEKDHPYSPICVGFAMPTRRKFYPLESGYTEAPLSFNEDGTIDDRPDDFLLEYLPKDGRPMSNGWRDLHGAFELNSQVGFFPASHEEEPADAGQDALSSSQFQQGQKPETNNPDKKYMVRCSKYGNFSGHFDVGYFWRFDDEDPEFFDLALGESKGEFDFDRSREVSRSKYLTRLFNEDQPDSSLRDQRRYEIRTRYGHKFEMRDVGWSQLGGSVAGPSILNRVPDRGEYGLGDDPSLPNEKRILSKWENSDERWIKLRTKGGHLIQMFDTGFHAAADDFVVRDLIEEIGPMENEDSAWTNRDARQLRLITRYGYKFVLDDRGTDTFSSSVNELPRGNGLLIKGRRSAQQEQTNEIEVVEWESLNLSGEPEISLIEVPKREIGDDSRGFGFEFNEKDELNTTRWYTPKSKLIEMNDKKDYLLMCTDMREPISEQCLGRNENEFAKSIGMTFDPEQDTYHGKLDKRNGYLRFKTAAGGDNGRNPVGLVDFRDAIVGLNQGLEARDGRIGAAWCEIVDIDHRGMWFSHDEEMSIWRSSEGKDQLIAIVDGENKIIIRNAENGPIQIFCQQNVEIMGQNVAIKALDKVSIQAGTTIEFEAGGTSASLKPGVLGVNGDISASTVLGLLPDATPGSGAGAPAPVTGDVVDIGEISGNTNIENREPTDRADTGDQEFDPVDQSIIG